jgi:hypothetical protein
MSIIFMVLYTFAEFVGCLMGLEISRGAGKLTRTPRVVKKKKKRFGY